MHQILVLGDAEDLKEKKKWYQNKENKLFHSGGGNRLNMGGQAESGKKTQKKSGSDKYPRSQRYQTALHKSQTGRKPQDIIISSYLLVRSEIKNPIFL